MNKQESYWVIIPAAGSSKRMQSSTPKQYLQLRGRMVIEHVLSLFDDISGIKGITVATAVDDPWWPEVELPEKPSVSRIDGGTERCHSVLNALESLNGQVQQGDWVLVHDAARPCLRRSDLHKLISTISGHPVGGLLGVPVRDTMKRTDSENNVYETVDRRELWHALTPQMFRFSLLCDALGSALDNNKLVTDEASALELYGKKPHMVAGCSDNIKITQPGDLALAEFYLQQAGNA